MLNKHCTFTVQKSCVKTFKSLHVVYPQSKNRTPKGSVIISSSVEFSLRKSESQTKGPYLHSFLIAHTHTHTPTCVLPSPLSFSFSLLPTSAKNYLGFLQRF